jgi:hypothetical protein
MAGKRKKKYIIIIISSVLNFYEISYLADICFSRISPQKNIYIKGRRISDLKLVLMPHWWNFSHSQ